MPFNDESRDMTDANIEHPPRRSLTRHWPGVVALVALIIAGAALYLVLNEPKPEPIGLPHGVVVVAACTFIAGLIAQIRAMSVSDWLEAALELVMKAVGLIAAALGALWGAITGLLW